MADTKITALAAITTVDPAADVLPIVDVSDTSMAASGTTKKITSNQILGAGGTATLASATITGDLTVDTSTLKVDSANNRVGIVQASPLYPLHLVGEFGLEEASAGNGSKLRMIGQSTKYNFRLGKQIAVDNAFEITPSTAVGGTTFSNPVYTVTYDGIHTFLDGAGGTRMTLNSTGLGVGGSPVVKLHLFDSTPQISFTDTSNSNYRYSIQNAFSALRIFNNTTSTEVCRFDASGNVGVGVTPKSWLSSYKAIQLGYSTSLSSTTGTDFAGLSSNAYVDSVDSRWERIVSGYATQYYQNAGDGQHIWRIAGTAAADTAITWTNAMTLSAAGSLVLGAAAVATTATDGFLYIPGCAGTPTGTPTSQTGRVPLVVDTTNNKLYFYSGGSWVAAN
jgi:hypothetical protein